MQNILIYKLRFTYMAITIYLPLKMFNIPSHYLIIWQIAHIFMGFLPNPMGDRSVWDWQMGLYEKRKVETGDQELTKTTTPYLCEWCEFHTSSKITMKEHRDCTHNGKLKCRKCNLQLKNFKTFVRHKYSNHNAGNCDDCDFRAKNRSQLKRHISKKHMNMPKSEGCNASQKYVRQSCPRFNTKVESADNLKIHLEECKPIQCDQCNQRRYSGQMEAHKRERHQQNKITIMNDTFTILDDMFPDPWLCISNLLLYYL